MSGGRRVQWSPAALHDIERLAGYLLEEAPLRAASIIDRIVTRAEALSGLPRRGRCVPELHGVSDESWRELLEHPWRIIYQVGPDSSVMVHAVFDGRRDLEDVLMERVLAAK